MSGTLDAEGRVMNKPKIVPLLISLYSRGVDILPSKPKQTNTKSTKGCQLVLSSMKKTLSEPGIGSECVGWGRVSWGWGAQGSPFWPG